MICAYRHLLTLDLVCPSSIIPDNHLPDGSKSNRVIRHVFIRMGKKYGKVSDRGGRLFSCHDSKDGGCVGKASLLVMDSLSNRGRRRLAWRVYSQNVKNC